MPVDALARAANGPIAPAIAAAAIAAPRMIRVRVFMACVPFPRIARVRAIRPGFRGRALHPR